MSKAPSRDQLIRSPDVRSFFHDSVARAMHTLDVQAAEHTVFYVVNLLTLYTRSDAFHDSGGTDSGTDEGIKPLALLLADAVDAPNEHERDERLRRLGDISLFVGGFFAHSLARSLVDVDYYIAMGGNAYGALSDRAPHSTRGRVFKDIYAELAVKFQHFVEVLGEISDMAYPNNHSDLLRLYEIWLRTGSQRAAARLRSLGVEPVASDVTTH